MANLWHAFRHLTGPEPLRVGTVTAHNSDGTSSLTDAHNRAFRAQGQDVAIGNKAFVKDGRIQGEAPNLTETTVYV